ncbi:MAG: DUF350 domain-containing protein [Myxococcota bacterium]
MLSFLAAAPHRFDAATIGRTAAFFAGSLVIVVIAKMVRDQIAARRGHRLPELVAKHDNVAVAVEMAGFVLAMVLGLLDSIMVSGIAWWEQALDLLTTGAVVLAVMLLNDQITSRVVLRGIDCNLAVVNRNLAVAIVRACANVASALVTAAALGHESPLIERVIWVLIGQLCLVILSLAYQKLTPYDDVKEVESQNVAAALPMGGILLAVGLVVAAALKGEGAGWGDDLVSLAIDLVVGAVLLFALRWAGDRFLLPGTTYKEEIARDRNAGAGLIEATSYVAGALAVAYFLS